MNNNCIHIEGSILSSDIIDKIAELKGQKPADFANVAQASSLRSSSVKDEISRAWADAMDYWRIYQRRVENLSENSHGITETRNYWIIPLLQLLGYKPIKSTAETVMGKSFAISHRSREKNTDEHGLARTNIEGEEHGLALTDTDEQTNDLFGDFPLHIMGCRNQLDKKPKVGLRMSPHGLVQEYLNLTEHLYGIVTNGLQLRLLRNSSRLVKLSYLEFDLEQIFNEGHYNDFALMYRLIHATRMPKNCADSAESLIEIYHQDSLDAGSRIRDGLSRAVEESILLFANGFLQNPANKELREKAINEENFEQEFYQAQLRLIYRLLFLMVIEERDLVYPKTEEQWQKIQEKQYPHLPKLELKKAKEIYYNFYSVARLRKLAGKRHLADSKHNDYWTSLQNTFRLFEQKDFGMPLGIQPLSGDIFSESATRELNNAKLDNKVVIECLTKLSIFEHPDTHQKIRVNYAALNVEEFGSVYEGLLEYDPVITGLRGRDEHGENNVSSVPVREFVLVSESPCPSVSSLSFSFKQGTGRSSSGSHYTPDELVTPLIKHSLDYLLADRVKIIKKEIRIHNLTGKENCESRKKLVEKHLYSLSVCDVACGSGHILLNAARRIGAEVANIIEEEEQPSPTAFRKAVRAVIQNCIYGVDLNPMAVELCKVALWLEAHNPGEPLNFLDHHIKCGNAIVGLAHQEELQNGIASEAFKKLPDDDKNIAAEFRNRNKKEIKERTSGIRKFDFYDSINDNMQKALDKLSAVNAMSENSVEDIEAKKYAYADIGYLIRELRTIANIQVAQFFIPKTEENYQQLITDEKYFEKLRGSQNILPQHLAKIEVLADKKRFFHWFLEFPQIMANGGFDCILGNPPFLGGTKISTNYGSELLEYLHFNYTPAKGSCDLVCYFFRRIFKIIKEQGFQALISTNTIAQGDTRNGGLAVINNQNGIVNFAIRSIRWPGRANVEVALLAIHKGQWNKEFILGDKKVKQITSYLDDTEYLGEPYQLKQNYNKSFLGSKIYGKGFVLTIEEAQKLIEQNPKNKDVLFPYLNGQDLNNNIDQSPSRWVINFFDWEEEYCRKNYPECFAILEETVKPERMKLKRKSRRENWWIYGERGVNLYQTIASLNRILGVGIVTKYPNLTFSKKNIVVSQNSVVFAFDKNIDFSFLSNSFHNEWAWKNCSTMGGVGLSYNPSDAFQTFPFPQNLSSELEEKLEKIGEEYHEFRRQLMVKLQLGLTKTYNQFHNSFLGRGTRTHGQTQTNMDDHFVETRIQGKVETSTNELFIENGIAGLNTDKLSEDYLNIPKKQFIKKHGKESFNLVHHLGKTPESCDLSEAISGICELRKLHKQMDELVLEAYGWHIDSDAGSAIDLNHDFYEVEYLPENDRVRYTIPSEVRKEILKRLLLLNHKIYAQEVEQGLHDKKKSASTRKKVIKKKVKDNTPDLFGFGGEE